MSAATPLAVQAAWPRWWHGRAEWAADFINDRAARRGSNASLNSMLSVERGSEHVLDGQTFAPDTLARIDGTGAYIGGAATNLHLQSNGISVAGTGGLASHALSSEVLSLLGGQSVKMVEDATTGWHEWFSTQVTDPTLKYTFSIDVHPGTHRWIAARLGLGGDSDYVSYDLQDGVVGTVTAGILSHAIVQKANGWVNISVTRHGSATGLSYGLRLHGGPTINQYSGSGTEHVYYSGVGLYQSSFAPPLVPTSGAVATRLASKVDVTSFSASEGFTIFVEARTEFVDTWAGFLDIHAASDVAGNVIRLGSAPGLVGVVAFVNAGNVVQYNENVALAHGFHKMALTVGANARFASDGVLAPQAAGVTMPTGLDRFYLGRDGLNRYLDTLFREVQIIRGEMSDAELIAMTS